MKANPSIKNANMIRVGQSVKIPEIKKTEKNVYKGTDTKKLAADTKKRKSKRDLKKVSDPSFGVAKLQGDPSVDAFKKLEPLNLGRKPKKDTRPLHGASQKREEYEDAASGGMIGSADMSAKNTSTPKKKKIPQYYMGGGPIKKGKKYANGGRVAKYRG